MVSKSPLYLTALSFRHSQERIDNKYLKMELEYIINLYNNTFIESSYTNTLKSKRLIEKAYLINELNETYTDLRENDGIKLHDRHRKG